MPIRRITYPVRQKESNAAVMDSAVEGCNQV
jgi:hypothetical protein